MTEVPPTVHTVTSTVPAVPAGLVTTSWLPSLASLTMVARVVPKYTAVALARLAPLMVTVVPPAAGPVAGVTPLTATLLMVGAAT